MKIYCLAMLWCGLQATEAQEAPAEFASLSPTWHQEYHNSIVLADKLFPDLNNPSSEMSEYMERVNFVLKANDSDVYSFADKPVAIALIAAMILKINPQWQNLSSQEKGAVLDAEVATVSITKDFRTQNLPSAPTRSSSTFDPGSMNDDSHSAAHHSIDDADPNQSIRPSVPASSGIATDPKVQSSRTGYIYFFNYLAHQSHWTSSNPASALARGGPFDGMNWGQAQNKAQNLWESLSANDQSVYQQKANAYGPGPDPAQMHADSDHSYDLNVINDPNR